MKEFSSALVESGHKVRQVPFYDRLPEQPFFKAAEMQASPLFLENLLQTAAEFQPDFIFTVNMLGFDTDGELLGLLDKLHLPVVNWFVDTPFGILTKETNADFGNILSLCWEKAFIPEFRQRFAKHRIEYMPYATALTGREKLANPIYNNEIAFIGSSMTEAVDKWRINAQIPSELEAMFSAAAKTQLFNLPPFVKAFFAKNQITDLEMQTFFYFLGSRLYRQAISSELSSYPGFAVYGDPGWFDYGTPGLKIKPSLDYYRETPQLFYNTKVNINITSPQMSSAINQRVFDIPAAGGFLLTDERADLTNLLSGNFVSFGSHDTLLSLTDTYLNDYNLRSAAVSSMQKEILQAHRYVHRLKNIFTIASDFFN